MTTTAFRSVTAAAGSLGRLGSLAAGVRGAGILAVVSVRGFSGMGGPPPPPGMGGPPPPPGMGGPLPPPPPPAGANGDTVTDGNFKETLLAASQSKMVILDVHADWCQPCKQLEPILRSTVASFGGSLVLKKLDVDANPQLGQILSIKELPTVFAVYGGAVVESFTGARSAADVQKWMQAAITKAGGAAKPKAAEEAMTLESTIATISRSISPKATPETLEAMANTCRAILQAQAGVEGPGHVPVEWKEQGAAEAKAGLALVCLYQGVGTEAVDLVENIRTSHKDKLEAPLVKRALAEVALYDPKATAADQDESALRARIEADGRDLAARVALSKLLFRQGEQKAAVDEALQVVKLDKTWEEGAGRVLLLSYFDVMGEANDLTRSGRRRMSNYLFN